MWIGSAPSSARARLSGSASRSCRSSRRSGASGARPCLGVVDRRRRDAPGRTHARALPREAGAESAEQLVAARAPDRAAPLIAETARSAPLRAARATPALAASSRARRRGRARQLADPRAPRRDDHLRGERALQRAAHARVARRVAEDGHALDRAAQRLAARRVAAAELGRRGHPRAAAARVGEQRPNLAPPGRDRDVPSRVIGPSGRRAAYAG